MSLFAMFFSLLLLGINHVSFSRVVVLQWLSFSLLLLIFSLCLSFLAEIKHVFMDFQFRVHKDYEIDLDFF